MLFCIYLFVQLFFIFYHYRCIQSGFVNYNSKYDACLTPGLSEKMGKITALGHLFAWICWKVLQIFKEDSLG